MRRSLFLIFAIIAILQTGCKPRVRSASPPPPTDNSQKKADSFDRILKNISPESIDSSLFTKADTVFVGFPGLDTVGYSREEFNGVVSNFPELYKNPAIDPDIAYHGRMHFEGFNEKPGFDCELGQDEYYAFYAWFLMKRDKGRMLAGKRDTLTRIYDKINEIFQIMNFGGTYFGHQSYRIRGMAEYSINEFSQYPQFFQKSYSIDAQRDFFIGRLKQQIKDEGFYNNENEKAGLRLRADVASIRALITDYFYLKLARRFLEDYYDVN